MFCALSLAIASVLHVMSDFRANSTEVGQTAVFSVPDGLGADGAQTSEACHSCAVAPYFNAAIAQYVAVPASDVPEGSRIQVSAVSLSFAGPPPKN